MRTRYHATFRPNRPKLLICCAFGPPRQWSPSVFIEALAECASSRDRRRGVRVQLSGAASIRSAKALFRPLSPGPEPL